MNSSLSSLLIFLERYYLELVDWGCLIEAHQRTCNDTICFVVSKVLVDCLFILGSPNGKDMETSWAQQCTLSIRRETDQEQTGNVWRDRVEHSLSSCARLANSHTWPQGNTIKAEMNILPLLCFKCKLLALQEKVTE